MADVFLSYARGDRQVAERLAQAIGETGLTVWWDRHIKGGSEFSRDIEKQLDAASRVLVLWSKEAVDSRWVRDEASVAVETRRLVSATIDGTPPPLGFRQFQTIDLKGWAAKGAPIPAELAEALEVTTPTVAEHRPKSPVNRRLVGAGVAAALIAAAAAIAIVRPPPFDSLLAGESQSEELPLAIMPFAVQGGAGIDYLGAGLSTALADALAPLSGLKLIASTSTQAISDDGLTAPEIGKKLGVGHLVEGNVQKSGERYSISVRLIEARKSEQVWARTFEGAAEDLQLIKNRMARELASAIRARLGVGGGAIREKAEVDPKAYEAYLRALEKLSVRDDRDARVEAIRQFRLAASIQPDFADAHAGYAYLMALSLPFQLGMPWEQLKAEQRRANTRALELDPDNDLALIAKAVASRNFDGDPTESVSDEEAVLKRSPNFGPAHYSRAASLWMQGRGREALGHLDHAIDRDPIDADMRYYRASLLYSLGDYEGVRETVQQCPAPCAFAGWYWVVAMAGFGTRDQYERDFDLLVERVKAEGFSPEALDNSRGTIEALVLGRPFVFPPVPEGERVVFILSAIAARLDSFERGLEYAYRAVETEQPDSVLDILNEGRLTFTPEQRADPRYHQLFRHPKLAKIAAARRKEGVTGGLPVFPVKPYTGR